MEESVGTGSEIYRDPGKLKCLNLSSWKITFQEFEDICEHI